MSKDTTDADIAFIRALAEILNENDLGEIEVSREFGEDQELTVRVARAGSAQAHAVPVPMAHQPPSPLPVAATAPAETAATQEAEAAVPSGNAVPSPMVGTVYLAPEPGAETFVKVGDTVAKGQTILIIEAMKTMNQIPAPRAGTVEAILVEDSEPVEYGSPLMTIA